MTEWTEDPEQTIARINALLTAIFGIPASRSPADQAYQLLAAQGLWGRGIEQNDPARMPPGMSWEYVLKAPPVRHQVHARRDGQFECCDGVFDQCNLRAHLAMNGPVQLTQAGTGTRWHRLIATGHAEPAPPAPTPPPVSAVCSGCGLDTLPGQRMCVWCEELAALQPPARAPRRSLPLRLAGMGMTTCLISWVSGIIVSALGLEAGPGLVLVSAALALVIGVGCGISNRRHRRASR